MQDELIETPQASPSRQLRRAGSFCVFALLGAAALVQQDVTPADCPISGLVSSAQTQLIGRQAIAAVQPVSPGAPDLVNLDPRERALWSSVALRDDPLESSALVSILTGDDAARDRETLSFPAVAEVAPEGAPRLHAKAWYVADAETGEVLMAHRADVAYPIASISKLMGAMVYVDAQPDPEEVLTLSQDDKDYLQITRSRLRVGNAYRAGDLLYHSLLPSDNRATVALMRQTGLSAELFKEAMNRRAQLLGLTTARFEEPTGLAPENMASARDVVMLLEAALAHPEVAPVITQKEHWYYRADAPVLLGARSSNRLSHAPDWDVIASKTGFTYAAGSCLVMKTRLSTGRVVSVAILGASGEKGRYPVADAIRKYIETL